MKLPRISVSWALALCVTLFLIVIALTLFPSLQEKIGLPTTKVDESSQIATLVIEDPAKAKKKKRKVLKTAAKVCVEGCIENTSDGKKLPKISVQGTRPFDVYRRPEKKIAKRTAISVVITELGLDEETWRFVKESFPSEVTCAFMPSAAHAPIQNTQARENGFETLLMVPMEPLAYPEQDPGSKTLLTNLPLKENSDRLQQSLMKFTGYIGVMPFMGSRFGRSKRDFQPVLMELTRRGLCYFEPRNTRSGAQDWHPSSSTLYAKGHFDLERGKTPEEIQAVLKRLEKWVSTKKHAILTVQSDYLALQAVDKWLKNVHTKDILLVPLSSMVTQK